MNNQLFDFTFKDTGKSVKIRKVSPMVALDVDRTFPRPEPPMNKVNYGEGEILEANLTDPKYLSLMIERNSKVNDEVTRVVILRGVVLEGDEWKAEVEEYKKFILETTGKELEENLDAYIYIMRVCVGTQADLNDLLFEITQRSQPTEVAVQAAKDSFQGNV